MGILTAYITHRRMMHAIKTNDEHAMVDILEVECERIERQNRAERRFDNVIKALFEREPSH